jgi:hypothetical protein
MSALSTRLTRLERVEAPDGAGGAVPAYVPRAGFWARVTPARGRARQGEWGEEARLSVRVLAHALPRGHEARPAPGDRIEGVDGTYAVGAVHAEGRWMTLWAERVEP